MKFGFDHVHLVGTGAQGKHTGVDVGGCTGLVSAGRQTTDASSVGAAAVTCLPDVLTRRYP
jgi:hypothetical protein